MPARSPHEQREVSHNQGNVQGNVYYSAPHPSARTEVVRVIPYPRNEDLVHRRDLIDRLDKLLPPTLGSSSAALWGLGGSGKTQIALDYAYRRCDADDKCCVFWVHADNEATFLADYKTIGKKLGVDERLDGTDLLDAVRSAIEARSKWVMVVDNADNLRLFGVGQGAQEKANQNLQKYVPCGAQGTVLWTSRDAHIAGTLVGPRRGIEVRSMTIDEATTLLARVRNEAPLLEEATEEAGVDSLLEELQRLPLAISQAGAYMRRIPMSATQYLALLRRGQTRWKVLKISDADRHRRPEVSNSVLETWRISTERIRAESEMSYQILHVVAYVDSQDIPEELMTAAASQHNTRDENSTRQATELEVLEAITRLKEFSFLGLRRKEDNRRSYEMHKLVQEAVRYGLGVRGLMETTAGKAPGAVNEPENSEAYYSGIALQIVDDLFPPSQPTSWAQCEEYLTHAVRVGEWAEVSRAKTETATLLQRVSGSLYDRGRWKEKEPVDKRALDLRREVLGEKHADTIRSMASLAVTYHEQGRYNEAEPMKVKALQLRRAVLGEKHPDTMKSMADLADIYHSQGRYNEAEPIYIKVLELRQEALREKHPDTIRSMADLAGIYYAQGRYDEAEGICQEVLDLRREVLGGTHPDTISSMADLAATYRAQGRYNKAEGIYQEVLDLRREVLGEKHPDTIRSMADLAGIYYAQGRYDEAEGICQEVLDLRREVLGGTHPDTISSMADLAATYHAQGRYEEPEEISVKVLDLQREVLGEKHPDTIRSMADLAATYRAQGRYNKAEGIYQEVLDLRREVLGEKHPDTIRSMADLAGIYYAQGRYDEAEGICQEVLDLRREVLGEKHPDTIRSMAELAVTYHAQGRYDEAEGLKDEALVLRQEVLGEKHPDTIQSMEYLASTQEALQQLPSPTESVQSLTVTQVGESKEDQKPRRRSLWEVLHKKAHGLRKSRSSRR